MKLNSYLKRACGWQEVWERNMQHLSINRQEREKRGDSIQQAVKDILQLVDGKSEREIMTDVYVK